IDRWIMGRAFAYLYGAGGTLVLATFALPSSSSRIRAGMVIPGVIAYGVTALMVLRAERLPLWVYRALPAFGALLVSIVAYASGPRPSSGRSGRAIGRRRRSSGPSRTTSGPRSPR